jgi:hypothetical protein
MMQILQPVRLCADAPLAGGAAGGRVSTDAPAMLATGAVAPPAFAFGLAAGWYLRNLTILLGAFFPALATAAVTADCVLRPAEKACGFALGKVLFVVIVLGIPAAVAGGLHLLVVLSIARRRPWVARAEAAALLPGLALAFGGAEWARAHPLGLPVLALCGAVSASMLRLDPRDRLGDAAWVWWIPAALVALNVVFTLAGVA